jgi:hypothetical protein
MAAFATRLLMVAPLGMTRVCARGDNKISDIGKPSTGQFVSYLLIVIFKSNKIITFENSSGDGYCILFSRGKVKVSLDWVRVKGSEGDDWFDYIVAAVLTAIAVMLLVVVGRNSGHTWQGY